MKIKIYIAYTLLLLISIGSDAHKQRSIIPYKTMLNIHNSSAITYRLNRGRLGDHLLTYIKAKYLSLKYNLPLLYKPFIHSNLFKLSTKELLSAKANEKKYHQHIYIETADDLFNQKPYTLFISSLKTKIKKSENGTFSNESIAEFLNFKKNKHFLHFLNAYLASKKTIEPIKLSANVMNIAVHVRKGDGYDPHLFSTQYDDTSIFSCHKTKRFSKRYEYSDVAHPRRFPPEQYYINQILLLHELFPEKIFFIYIFTDSKKPHKIVERFKIALSTIKEKLIIRFNQKGTNQPQDILNDMFTMAQFDYLIRPSSSFSKCAQILGNFKITLEPVHHIWNNNKLIIDTIRLTYFSNDMLQSYCMPTYNNKTAISEIKRIFSSIIT